MEEAIFDGAEFTTTSALANSQPDGSYLIITNNNLGVKSGYAAEVARFALIEYLAAAMLAVENYAIS